MNRNNQNLIIQSKRWPCARCTCVTCVCEASVSDFQAFFGFRFKVCDILEEHTHFSKTIIILALSRERERLKSGAQLTARLFVCVYSVVLRPTTARRFLLCDLTDETNHPHFIYRLKRLVFREVPWMVNTFFLASYLIKIKKWGLKISFKLHVEMIPTDLRTSWNFDFESEYSFDCKVTGTQKYVSFDFIFIAKNHNTADYNCHYNGSDTSYNSTDDSTFSLLFLFLGMPL